jgi:hypothetical protein
MSRVVIEPLSIAHSFQAVVQLKAAVEAMHRRVPLVSVLWRHIPAQPPNVYRYRIVAVDGRVWLQDPVTFATPPTADPTMDFTATGWKLSEFALQREIRNFLVNLVVDVGLQEFEYIL